MCYYLTKQKQKHMTTRKIQLKAFCKKDASGAIRIVATDETIDRSGESIPFESWDLSNFEKSPRLLIDHDYSVKSIVGKATNIQKDETIRALTFEPLFHDITQAARDTKELVEQGFLDTVSVGFLRREDEKGVSSNELMEVSFVAVPANANARVLAVKDITSDEEKAVEAFVKDEPKESAKEPMEGDACTMEDGTEGVMTMMEDGTMSCQMKPVKPADGEEGAKGKKGAIADELSKQDQWKKKWENFQRLDAPVSAAWRVYFNEDTEVEAFPGIVAEIVEIFKTLAGSATATDSVATFMETEEGKDEAAKSMQSRDAKSGRVLSQKNRDIVQTAKDAMASSIVALEELLKASEGQENTSEGDDGEKKVDAREDKSYQRFIELRKITRAAVAAFSDALRDAKLN